MLEILIDSNILIRLLDRDSVAHPECAAVLTPEHVDQCGLCMCAQTLIEFWVVCTRPRPQNGLGISPSALAAELERLERIIPCLAEPPDIATVWRSLVTRYQVSGKLAHDTRIAALMCTASNRCSRSTLRTSPDMSGSAVSVQAIC